jgi:hypothetical protein
VGRVETIAEAPHKEIPDPNELQARAFTAFGEWLARLRDRQPVVLYIDDLQWTMYAAATRRRLAQLLGGDEGAGLVARAEAFMRGQAIKNIDAMTELHCPGS